MQTGTYPHMLLAVLVTTANRQKQSKCPSMAEWVNKLWCIHVMKYYSVINRNEVLIDVSV
jgi:hypothetical protein